MGEKLEIKLFNVSRLYHILAGRSLICKVSVSGTTIIGVFTDRPLDNALEEAIRVWAKRSGYLCPQKLDVLGTINPQYDWQPEHR